MTSERNALEALAIERTHCKCHPETCCCGDYTLCVDGEEVITGSKAQLEAIVSVARRLQPARVPEGWRERRQAEIDDLSRGGEFAQGKASGIRSMLTEFDALLAAAPAAEGVKAWCETCRGSGAIFNSENVLARALGDSRPPCTDCDGKGYRCATPAPESREADHSPGAGNMVPEAPKCVLPKQLIDWLSERDLIPDADEDRGFDVDELVVMLTTHEHEIGLVATKQKPEAGQRERVDLLPKLVEAAEEFAESIRVDDFGARKWTIGPPGLQAIARHLSSAPQRTGSRGEAAP